MVLRSFADISPSATPAHLHTLPNSGGGTLQQRFSNRAENRPKPTSGGAPTHPQPSGKTGLKPTSGGAPTRLHTLQTCIPAENRCGPGWAGPGGTAIRASHLALLLLSLYIYILYTILFYKRYAECAEYAETQKSSTEPRFHGASAAASSAHPAPPEPTLDARSNSLKCPPVEHFEHFSVLKKSSKNRIFLDPSITVVRELEHFVTVARM